MYNPATFGEWQMSCKICYSFCRSIRATMWRMVGQYKGNENGKIVVLFRSEVGIRLWQMAQVGLADSLAWSARPVIVFVSWSGRPLRLSPPDSRLSQRNSLHKIHLREDAISLLFSEVEYPLVQPMRLPVICPNFAARLFLHLFAQIRFSLVRFLYMPTIVN